MFAAVFCAPFLGAALDGVRPAETQTLLVEEGRWFDLRDVQIAGADLPLTTRGALSAAFNDVSGAETSLRTVIRENPKSAEAVQAYGELASLYNRVGRNRAALAEIENLLKLNPDDTGVLGAREIFAFFARFPETEVVRRGESRVPCSRKEGPVANLFFPLSVNGVGVRYMLDTGAGQSLISESEALRLGLKPESMGGSMKNATGEDLTPRWALASSIRIGNCELKNVLFAVLPDSMQPFSLLPEGEKGIVGIPVFAALGTLTLGRDGEMSVGRLPGAFELAKANLCFDKNALLVRAEHAGKALSLELDTGGLFEYLSPRFALEFPEVVSLGEKKAVKMGGVGGGREGISSAEVKEVSVKLGGMDVYFRPAVVLLDKVDAASVRHHGLAGLPVLSQARALVFDFKAMTLVLE